MRHRLDCKIVAALIVGVCLLSTVACHRGTAESNPDAPKTAAPISQADKDAEERGEALKLRPADMVKLGIVVAPVAPATFLAEATGYGQVIGRDAVIQALSENEVARIRATQSHAALERSRKLEGTAGADAISEHESAVRQDAEDRSAVFLAQAKTRSLLGQQAAQALGADHILVDGLLGGRYKLIRVTLPLGAVHGDTSPALRLARLDAGPGEADWHALHVWPGPVDGAVPGRAFVVMVDAPQLAEGEHLMAYASAGNVVGQDEPLQGALVPSSALVITAGDAWVYVERDIGNFSRERLDTTHPLPTGYFVTGKLGPGTRVITAGAGLLLSRELDVSPDD